MGNHIGSVYYETSDNDEAIHETLIALATTYKLDMTDSADHMPISSVNSPSRIIDKKIYYNPSLLNKITEASKNGENYYSNQHPMIEYLQNLPKDKVNQFNVGHSWMIYKNNNMKAFMWDVDKYLYSMGVKYYLNIDYLPC